MTDKLDEVFTCDQEEFYAKSGVPHHKLCNHAKTYISEYYRSVEEIEAAIGEDEPEDSSIADDIGMNCNMLRADIREKLRLEK